MRRRRLFVLAGVVAFLLLCVWLAKPPTLAEKVNRAGIILVRQPDGENQTPKSGSYAFAMQDEPRLTALLKSEGFSYERIQGIDDQIYKYSKDEPFFYFFKRHREVCFFVYNGHLNTTCLMEPPL